MSDEIRVYARVYRSQLEARRAYEQAVRTYVLGAELEVGFTLAAIPGTGWIVAAVGRDASSGMIDGGEEIQLAEEVRRLLAERFTRNRPSPHGRWIIRNSFPDGLVLHLPRLH